MESVSHRWYRTWERWNQEEWNVPSRSDNYLMQICQRIQQVMQKQPNKFTLAMQKIPFVFNRGKKEAEKPEMTKEEKIAAASAASKALWASRGFK